MPDVHLSVGRTLRSREILDDGLEPGDGEIPLRERSSRPWPRRTASAATSRVRWRVAARRAASPARRRFGGTAPPSSALVSGAATAGRALSCWTPWRSASTSWLSDPSRTLLSSSFSRISRTLLVRLSMTSFWSAMRLAVGLRLIVDARVDRLDRFGDRPEQVLQRLVLLLQHPEVGHQLPLFLALAAAGVTNATVNSRWTQQDACTGRQARGSCRGS